ncbi:CoA-binding protein [Kribbella catacumbae]|uniref:CoA-binding protein n=1 Tax=Kribbella catacumbae TaxID=460086 RepID=UPI00035EEEB6|nr:CoA-binding protein [Kribbella catacumbae]
MELASFRDPASVAVVGASNNPAKWGYWLARGALGGRHRRDVFLVNHKGSSVLGQPAWRDLGELPSVPELVVVCVPATSAADVIDQGLKLGVPAVLAITARLADGIAERVRAAGARLLGPNSLGLYDAAGELQLAWGDFTPGSLAVVSQSGQLGLEIAGLGERLGIGLSRFVSIGNQADLHARELLEDLVDDSATRVVAVYLESFADGNELVRVLSRLTEAGKPVLLLTTGGSDGSQRLARSHTGSLTSALDVVDAACRAAGALRVATPTELVNTAALLLARQPVRGRRLAVVSDSGGQGGIAADVAVSNGLLFPAFSPELRERLAGVLPAGASVANPVDLAGAGEADLFAYPEAVRLAQESGEVDAMVLSGYFGCYGEDSPSLSQVELEINPVRVSPSGALAVDVLVVTDA